MAAAELMAGQRGGEDQQRRRVGRLPREEGREGHVEGAQLAVAAYLKAGTEDTQLAFYALLTGHDTPRAAYLNVGERDPAKLHESPDITALAALLADGIQHDLARVAAGAPLPALGEGSACDWCAARGLCRKDFWSQP